MDAKKFGAFLAATRKEKKMTQAELAEQIHVTDKAISRWERGGGFPDIQTLEPLAQALGISVLELMRSERQIDLKSKQIQGSVPGLHSHDHAVKQHQNNKSDQDHIASSQPVAVSVSHNYPPLIDGSLPGSAAFLPYFTGAS